MNTLENNIQQLPIAEIIFREDLYPRIETNPSTVQKYAETIDVLPPIIVNQRYELIDGWHRWTAHKKLNIENISVQILNTNSDAHLLELAIEYNATHGIQLSQEDKRNMARSLYHVTPDKDRENKKKHLSKILSVSERTVRDWLSRIDKDSKESRNKRIFDLWLACHTQEEIAERENVTKETVSQICQKMAELSESDKPVASHLTDFDPPIYNIWKQQSKTKGSSHFGNSEVKWLDNLLYLYTKPLDIVVDPFSGGGSTVDLCKKRFRRYWTSDRKPIVEREKDIRQHDLMDGLPQIPRWKDVKLVYLDPPYWKQAEGQYSDSPNDLANMTIEDFNKNLSSIIGQFSKKLQAGSYIALIIQPTQWKTNETHDYTDHVGDMLKMVKLPVEMRYSVPYESQQNNAQMVIWAKENKKCLVITREIIVWRI
ncbi:MAG: DNA methyltransferase [Deltaproteobacteria bacterium]